MSDFEIAKIYAVEGSIDRPVSELKSGASAEISVQFNPTSLKVALANSLKENERSGNTRAAQFVDKSSSNLTVELIFDTTDQFVEISDDEGNTQETDKRKDVRTLTGAIAQAFMAPNANAAGNEEQAPHRCMFAWGTFAFVGIMESFDETLDFFSSEGTPLRATVAIKIAESRYQFRSEEAKSAERDTPTQSPAAESMNDASWRNTALFNGVESPRSPTSESLSKPGSGPAGGSGLGGLGGGGLGGGIGGGISAGISGGIGAGISGGISGGIGGGISGGFGASAGIGISGGASLGGSFGASADLGGLSASASITPPSFKFGASSSIGTSIPGAFSLNTEKGSSFSAGSIIASGKSVSTKSGASASFSASASASASGGFSATASASGSAKASASIGFD